MAQASAAITLIHLGEDRGSPRCDVTLAEDLAQSIDLLVPVIDAEARIGDGVLGADRVPAAIRQNDPTTATLIPREETTGAASTYG